MFKDIQIAWKNLWRNRKRTLITVSAVILAVLLSTLTSSMQEGTYARMIDNIVKFYTGYIQIHRSGYWESKSINDTYAPDSLLKNVLQTTDEIQLSVPRLESFTLVSTGEHTRGCSLIGIDPDKEDSLTGLSKWVKEGQYLEMGSDGLLLAVNIVKSIGAEIGDTLILISQGYQGSSASALMPLKGILEFPSPQLNNFAAYIDLGQAGSFFSAQGMISSMSLMVKDYLHVEQTAEKLSNRLTPYYSVKTWAEMQPELVNMIQGDRAGAVIMKGILYLVVGFGILGTIIMMMVERRKELGIMVAIGMQKYRLQRMLTFESIFIGFLGVAVGVCLSIPIILYFSGHPVPLTGETGEIYERFGFEAALFFTISPKIFINQAITIFMITVLISVYPIITVAGMQVIKAIRGQ